MDKKYIIPDDYNYLIKKKIEFKGFLKYLWHSIMTFRFIEYFTKIYC